jgi:hypothetical protein
MSKKISILIIAGISIVLIFLLIGHIYNKSGGKSVSPFKYNLEDFHSVENELISHKEVRQIDLPQKNYIDIDYLNGKIYLLSEDELQIILPQGTEFLKISIEQNPSSFTVSESGDINICYENYIICYNADGKEFRKSEAEFADSYFSSIAVGKDLVFVADAGKKQVIIYDKDLVKVLSFKGESGVSDVHGFIVPGNQFALAIDADDELWVVNPGLHAIQNYSHEGRLRGYWSKTSFEPDGFTGCCNPCFLKILNNGDMLTSEKGLVRVKIHKESGELISIAAPPEKFKTGGSAPAIAFDEDDNIIILDFDNNMIRFFNKSDIFEN